MKYVISLYCDPHWALVFASPSYSPQSDGYVKNPNLAKKFQSHVEAKNYSLSGETIMSFDEAVILFVMNQ